MELQQENSSVIIIFDVSYAEDFEVIRKYIVDQEIPFIAALNQDNLVRFEWYFSPENNSATLIEIAKDSDAWEELANKVIGSPVNEKFNEFFTIEKLTVLGEASDSLREKIEPMNPEFRPYVAGFATY
tara:strand:- start:235 stop:618 length:384 start_codon:yes stop_codon:yes gene_type:complete